MTWMSLNRKRRFASRLFYFATLISFTNLTSVRAQDSYFPQTSYSDTSVSDAMPYLRISENPAVGGEKPTDREAAMLYSGDAPSNSANEGHGGNLSQTQGELQLQATGQIAFQNRCVQCHDAEKSLLKYKSLSSWRATVARMARR